jgi:hypothetical protein
MRLVVEFAAAAGVCSALLGWGCAADRAGGPGAAQKLGQALR